MQAQRNHKRVGERDNDGEDKRREVVDGLEEVTERGTTEDAQWADEEGGERDHHEHAEERDKDQLDAGRDDLFQVLGEEPEHGGHQQRWEHLRAVVGDGQRETEDLDDGGVTAEDALCPFGGTQGGEAGKHHHGHNAEAHPRVGTEALGRVVSDHQGQEDKNARPHQVDKGPPGLEGDAGGVPRGDHTEGGHQGHKGDEERRAEQGAQDRAEGVGEHLEEGVEPGELAARSLGTAGSFEVGDAGARARLCH